MEKNYKDIQESLIKNLDIVFGNKTTSTYLAGNKSFQDIIENLLGCLSYCIQKTKSSETPLTNLKNKFKKIINRDLNIKTKKYKDIYELLDEVNYLNVYVKNTFKADINELSKINNEPKTNDVELKVNQSSTSQAQQNISAINDLTKKLSAHQSLNEKIRSGKFFIYDSKPKIIPILRKTFLILSALFCLTVLLISCFMIAVQKFKNGFEEPYNYSSTIFLGVIYVIYTLGISWYVYKLLKHEYTNKNENEIYHFKFTYLSILICLFSIIFIFDLFSFKFSGHTSFFDSFQYILKNNLNIQLQLWGWYVSTLILMGILILMIITYVAGVSFNSKVDVAKINEIMADIQNELFGTSKEKPINPEPSSEKDSKDKTIIN